MTFLLLHPIYHLVFPQNGFKTKTCGFMRELLLQDKHHQLKDGKTNIGVFSPCCPFSFCLPQNQTVPLPPYYPHREKKKSRSLLEGKPNLKSIISKEKSFCHFHESEKSKQL